MTLTPTLSMKLQLSAQNALDIATHLAVSGGRDAPYYASAIDVLGELGVLPAEFGLRFRGIAGIGKVLVHGYLGSWTFHRCT